VVGCGIKLATGLQYTSYKTKMNWKMYNFFPTGPKPTATKKLVTIKTEGSHQQYFWWENIFVANHRSEFFWTNISYLLLGWRFSE